jgi:Mitochondrial sulfhydryl oxidase involved in the biogenesis of cytosolic Fe/S proteins
MTKINPKVWGPHAWKFLESVVEGYGKNPSYEDMVNFRDFFELLQDTLPCPVCRDNFRKHLRNYPLTKSVLQNKYTLMHWLNKIRRAVDETTRNYGQNYYSNNYSNNNYKYYDNYNYKRDKYDNLRLNYNRLSNGYNNNYTNQINNNYNIFNELRGIGGRRYCKRCGQQ